MQARTLKAGRGFSWLIEGLALVRRSPMPILSATSTLAMIVLLLLMTPLIGQVAFFLLLPVLEVGVFLVCRAVSEGETTHPALLFSGFRMNLRALFSLGGIRLVTNLVALWLAVVLSGVDIERLSGVLNAMDEAAMRTQALSQLGLIGVFMLLRMPLEMACWYAAPCVALRGVSVRKALFFSFVACWRNFSALVVFMVSLSLLLGFLPGVLLSALGLAASPVALPLLAIGIVLGVALFYAAFYRSACDVFGAWPHPLTHER